MENQLIPERLKMAREKLGITMAEASRRLNLSKIGYCRYEYGDRTPSSQTVDAIAECFWVSSAYLYGDSESMSPDYLKITKKDNPLLYNLILECRDVDDTKYMHLLEYIKLLKNKS